MNLQRIYLDHAATTPLHPEVIAAMVHVMEQGWGNPSSLHTEGRIARKAREQARAQVAQLFGADPSQIFFTSSGSESDQWAILGVAKRFEQDKGNLISATIEHSAVRNVLKQLETKGWELGWIKPDRFGFYPVEQLQTLINQQTKLVSLMYCNNELGTVQDIYSLCQVAHSVGALFHTDAVQALGKLPTPLACNPDLVSLASHKINGPKGVGALWIREDLVQDFPPWIAAASQERGKHAGTEAIPAIVGFGKACEVWFRNREAFHDRLSQLKANYLNELARLGCDYTLISPTENCSDSIVNLQFENCEAEALLLGFDMVGIASSAGSACASGALKPSSVLTEIGLTEKQANECVRFSFGPSLTMEEVIEAANRVAKVVEKQRRVVSGG